jgi:hypothetical protein
MFITQRFSIFTGLILAVIALAGQRAAAQEPQATPALSSPASQAPASQLVELPPAMTDAREIVRRSVEADHKSWELARSYTCRQREVEKQLGKHGEVKSTTIKTYDVNFYYGREYSRLIEKDDQPLNEADQKKEDEKLEKFLAKLRDQSEEEREKRAAKEKKEREEERAFLRDMLNAYDFTLLGEENVGGTDTYVIEAVPRKDFHPTQPHADILSKIKGRLWIEKKEYNWVKVEAESIDTISFGFFLARVHKGARFNLEQVHLNDEVWLVRRFYISGGARLALVKNMVMEQEDTFSSYKKFVTTSRILPGVKEVPAEQPK